MAVASITEQAGRTVVALSGEIDMGEAPKVRRALLDSIKKKRDILVDLAQVTYIDSSGIANLIEGLQAARKQKNDLALVSVSQCARRVLELVRLHRVFIVHADLATAFRSDELDPWRTNQFTAILQVLAKDHDTVTRDPFAASRIQVNQRHLPVGFRCRWLRFLAVQRRPDTKAPMTFRRPLIQDPPC